MIAMRNFSILWVCALAVAMCACQERKTDGSDAEMDAFITELMGKMTLDEKLGQITLSAGADVVTGSYIGLSLRDAVARGELGGVFNVKGAEKIRDLQQIAVDSTRLGIPLLIGMDIIHGYETIFPMPLAMSCSWNMADVERSAQIAAVEATAGGINWTFSPMVDIARDPRWGRMAEGAGEDPYLGGQVAAAMVRGYQGSDLASDTTMLSCIKHFALYGAAEAGRDYNTVDMSRSRMYNDYLYPYQAGIDAGAATVMTSFNLVEGVPATANKWLITDVLRREWGFQGMVVTDYGSINEMYAHGVADKHQATVMAINAGTDMDMCSFGFITILKASLEAGEVSMQTIDAAVRRVLEAKYKLGLFSDPYRYCDIPREATDIYTAAHRAEARAIAARTLVLLKNDGDILPLAKSSRIALIGPMADNAPNQIGSWVVAADVSKYSSVLQGFRSAVEAAGGSVAYAKGANFYSDPVVEAGVSPNYQTRDPRSDAELLAEARRVAAGADVIVLALGEAAESSGESASRSDLTLPANQRALAEAMLATGKPVVLLNFSGRATVMTWEAEHVPAILNVWFAGSEAGDAIADVVFGDVVPSGRLSVTMPRSVGQLPLYYRHMSTGRPVEFENSSFLRFQSNYIDITNAPLYPFGYGLSYTTFEYSDFTLDADTMTADGTIRATVKVTNTGRREGTETVQFYIHDVLATTARPVAELRHFEQVTLQPGQSAQVTFPITVDDLKYYNAALEYVAEPGQFEVMVGPNSATLTRLPFTLQ